MFREIDKAKGITNEGHYFKFEDLETTEHTESPHDYIFKILDASDEKLIIYSCTELTIT